MTTVLVTGANKGIGFEFARQYAGDGARVYATCRSPDSAEALNALARESAGRVTVHRLDVTNEADIADIAALLGDDPLDMLVNNAGIGADLHLYEPASNALWEEVIRTNSIAPVRIAWTLKKNLARGAKQIINISSGRGSHARHRGDGLAYCSSKAALNSAMYGLSVLWKNEGFTIVMLAPGVVITDLNPGGRLTPEFSVGEMRKVIGALTAADTGRYLSYEGKDILW
jgi:NAD(P)-dependent dehydrogenase (short-subunit alcohol dehydrogenase family)